MSRRAKLVSSQTGIVIFVLSIQDHSSVASELVQNPITGMPPRFGTSAHRSFSLRRGLHLKGQIKTSSEYGFRPTMSATLAVSPVRLLRVTAGNCTLPTNRSDSVRAGSGRPVAIPSDALVLRSCEPSTARKYTAPSRSTPTGK